MITRLFERQFGYIKSPFDGHDWQLGAHITTGMEIRRKVLRLRYKLWEYNRVLDQLKTNHCVGFSYADFGNALPIDSNLDAAVARDIYYLAKFIEGDPSGENGTTLRDGAKAFKQLGRIEAYAFSYSVSEIAAWLFERGPVVVGTPWYEDMMLPDGNGFVHPRGLPYGGHAWLLIGADYRNFFNQHFIGLNSWGKSWGNNGTFKISKGDLAMLLRGGEALTAVELPLPVKSENPVPESIPVSMAIPAVI